MTADQVRNASFEVFFDTDVCPLGTPWAVKGSELGELKGCYASNEAAHAAATAFSELDQPGEVSSKTTNSSREPLLIRRADGVEERAISEFESRQAADGSWTITGYASTFNDPYKVRDQYGTFIETIATGAWDGSLNDPGHKIQLLASHVGIPYGSTRAKNPLRLSPDRHGLGFEWQPNPRRELSVDLAEGIADGSVDEMSVGMRIPDGGDAWDGDKRTISQATLMEISVVARGANPNTEAAAREQILAEIRHLQHSLGMTSLEDEQRSAKEAERRIQEIARRSRLAALAPIGNPLRAMRPDRAS